MTTAYIITKLVFLVRKLTTKLNRNGHSHHSKHTQKIYFYDLRNNKFLGTKMVPWPSEVFKKIALFDGL